MSAPNTELSEPTWLQKWLLAAGLAGLGFWLNGLPLQISPGIEVVMGGALVFAAYRVLSWQQFALAFSFSAARTVLVWGHPWAWLVWTIEGAFLAKRRSNTSPVILDIAFWICGGGLLLWFVYRHMLGMDTLSLQLTVLKQAINAVLNVTIGEILFIGGSHALRVPLRRWVSPVSIGSIFLPSFVALAVVPPILMMRIEAPSWENALRETAALRLSANLDENLRKLDEFALRSAKQLDVVAPRPGSIRGEATTLSVDQSAPFTEVVLLSGSDIGDAAAPADQAQGRVQLLGQEAGEGLFLKVAVAKPVGAETWIVAQLRDDTVSSFLAPAHVNSGQSVVLLVDPKGRIAGVSAGKLPERSILQLIINAPRDRLATIRPLPDFGTSLVNRARETAYVRSAPVPAFPGWRLVTATWVRAEILDQRRAQARSLAALAVIILGIAALSAYLSRAFLGRLRSVAQGLSDLALGGADPAMIKSVLVYELAEIMTWTARTGALVSHERELLLTNRRRMESIARYAPVVIFSYDHGGGPGGPLRYISENAAALLGYEAHELLDASWWQSNLHPDDQHAWAEVVQPGRATTKEYRLRHKDGHFVWVYECSAISDTQPQEVVGVMIDISDRKKIAEQLSFRSKMESLGRIAAGIAHELNQPLQIIRFAAQNLEFRLASGSGNLSGGEEKLEIIKGQVDRATTIVRQVNAFGKPRESVLQPVPLEALIKSTCGLLNMQISDDDTELVCEPIDERLVVFADPLKLEQVIINLVQNARQAIAKKKRKRPGRIVLSAVRADGGVCIRVDDNGGGIEPASLPFVFEPFFTTKSDQGGTGLGLSVSYGIITEMGGRIWAENLSKGARFSVWLKEALQMTETPSTQ